MNNKNINEIIEILNSGKAVILPTDTVYGLFISAKFNSDILYDIKNRDMNKKLVLYTKNWNYDIFGPITIVDQGQGKRYLQNDLWDQIYDRVGDLIGTSANISNQSSITRAKHCKLNVPIYINDEMCLGYESTVFDINSKFIYRQGLYFLNTNFYELYEKSSEQVKFCISNYYNYKNENKSINELIENCPSEFYSDNLIFKYFK